jgi:hypothetical protein
MPAMNADQIMHQAQLGPAAAQDCLTPDGGGGYASPMNKLTDQQSQAVAEQPNRPLELIDPVTQKRYVLVRAEEFERLRASAAAPAGPAEAPLPAGVLRAQQAFWRELPRLLTDRHARGRWVLFHGDRLEGFARHSWELYQKCTRLDIPNGEYYIGQVVEYDQPPWEPLEIDYCPREVEDQPADRPGA